MCWNHLIDIEQQVQPHPAVPSEDRSVQQHPEAVPRGVVATPVEPLEPVAATAQA